MLHNFPEQVLEEKRPYESRPYMNLLAYFLSALALSWVLYKRTEQSQSFFICQLNIQCLLRRLLVIFTRLIVCHV